LVPPDPPAEHELCLLAGRDPVGLIDQLQRQALELGQRLQVQQSDLDRREAEFHARIAKVENQLRTARLVCAEREQELNEKLLEADAAAANSALGPAAVANFRRVDAAETVPVPMPASSRARSGIPIVNPTLNGTHWETRLAELEKSERLLQSQLAQVAFDRRKLDAERAALVEARQRQKEVSTAAVAESKLKFEQELLRLQTWSQQLDRRKLAVDQLHQEASRMYREALEMRLCTEQLWAEINEATSPAESTQRISELRCKLMDQFHLANQQASEQKEELEALIERLESHQETLRQQRDELRHWIARRHAEIEVDAEKLLNRERELDRQDAEIARLKSAWSEQRHEYEQKIRRLSRLVNSATL
jgi:chromosome segregation ATPase